MNALAVALILLTSCATWRQSHAAPTSVCLDPGLPPCEALTIRRAVRFWQAQGALLSEPTSLDQCVWGPGTIAVIDGDIDDPSLAGLTRQRLVPQDGVLRLESAIVVLDSCLPEVAAHEIGHALGLGHNDLPGSLMFPVVFPGTWALLESERKAVRP